MITPVRVLLAAALAATGHAGACVLIAVLTCTTCVVRTLLPVLPQIAIAGVALAVMILCCLAARSIWSWPHIAGVAR